MKAFKIKDSDGDFSTGGRYPNWTKRGKTWGSLQAIKLHVRQFCSRKRSKIVDGNYKEYNFWQNDIPKSWVVVELSEEGIKEYSAKELYPKTEEK